jgi:hypothetical protein
MVTAQRIRELLHYDPNTGVFTRLVSTSSSARAGGVAGSRHCDGYSVIWVDSRIYRSHRLAWLWMTGEWPTHQIDHINLDRADNRWSNLRHATQSQNMANTQTRANNAGTYKGVVRQNRKWRVKIQVNSQGDAPWLFQVPRHSLHCVPSRVGADPRGFCPCRFLYPRSNVIAT